MTDIEYIDLPQIPKELFSDEYTNLVDMLKTKQTFATLERDYFKTRIVSWNLRSWILNEFRIRDIKVRGLVVYQYVYDNIPKHKDVGRTVAYNYILHPGGDQVHTNVYDDNKELLTSVKIEPFKWHKLDVSKYHDVSNIVPGNIRIGISID